MRMEFDFLVIGLRACCETFTLTTNATLNRADSVQNNNNNFCIKSGQYFNLYLTKITKLGEILVAVFLHIAFRVSELINNDV